MVSSDLLLPGTPTVQINGEPAFVGTLEGPGEEEPSGYSVTLNDGSVLRYLVSRVDPIEMPTVDAPPAPLGVRDVTVDKAGADLGDFSTLRNLTLNGKAGAVAVPPGTYGWFAANGSSSLVLGDAESEEPVEYNLQGLVLNSKARIDLVGPVVLTLANGLTLDGAVNADGEPDWLTLRVASGDFNVNRSGAIDGHLVVPNGAVTISDTVVNGTVVSDRIILNSGASLVEPTP